MPLENNVNHKNMIVMWNFLKAFAKENDLSGNDINIFKKLNLPYPEKYKSALKYYTDPKQWSPLETYVQCYLKTKEITGDPNTFRNCGRSAIKYKSIDNWKDIAKTVSGPKAAINHMPNIFPDWNDTKTIEMVEAPQYKLSDKKLKAILKYTFHPHIDPCDDFCSDLHIRGIFEALPTNWPEHLWKPWKMLPLAEVKQPLVQYDPIKLFNSRFFSHLNLRPEFKENDLYIQHPLENQKKKIGRKVILLPTQIDGKPIFLGDYDEIGSSSGNNPIGTLITETITINGEPVCEKGVIMGAPYFLIFFSCKEIGATEKFLSIKNKFSGSQILLQELFQTNKLLRGEIGEKNRAFKELESFAVKLEEKVEERTKELREAQQKLVEAEKRALESRITGGFAHEMRNALAGAQLEFTTCHNYKESGKTVVEVLKEAATSLLKNINDVHERFKVPREEIAKHFIPEIKLIAEISEHLSITISGVSRDLDRGLAITKQIRDFAKLAEMRPGTDEVDLMALLNHYKDQYRKDFEAANINYTVTGPEHLVIKAEETHLNSIFSNLILNAKDAIIEKGQGKGKIDINVKSHIDGIIIKVSDNGPGIPQKNVKEIFEPFFSTKPTTGTGLGLGIVKKLVTLYDGEIRIESNVGSGTTFTITLPESRDQGAGISSRRAD
ncbi:MAG: HAMP domain-containing histidine kinase [Desulfobacteraceae bacterium]|nr:HAMP domain-containing histidine kinase [Desulfobacteraceae bacterium]